jgi:hypothetical protein
MIDNDSNKLVEISTRLKTLEKLMAHMMEKDPSLWDV